MAKRFSTLIKSFNGSQYTIEIWDKDWTGSSNDFVIGTGGPIITYDTNGNKKFSEILPSTCKIPFLVRSASDQLFINNLRLSRSERDVYVIIYEAISDGPIWSGFIVLDLGSEGDESYPYEVQLRAVDGIALLKNMDFVPDNTDREPYTKSQTYLPDNYQTFIYWIKEIASKIGLSTTTDGSNYNYKIATAVHWYNEDMQSPITSDLDPLRYTKAQSSQFYSIIDDTATTIKYKASTVYEVLTAICKAWGMRCIFWNNTLYFIQISEYDSSETGTITSPVNITTRFYNNSGTFTGSSANIGNGIDTHTAYDLQFENALNNTTGLNKLSGSNYGFYPIIKLVRSDFLSLSNVNYFTSFPNLNISLTGNGIKINSTLLNTFSDQNNKSFSVLLKGWFKNNNSFDVLVDVNWSYRARLAGTTTFTKVWAVPSNTIIPVWITLPQPTAYPNPSLGNYLANYSSVLLNPGMNLVEFTSLSPVAPFLNLDSSFVGDWEIEIFWVGETSGSNYFGHGSINDGPYTNENPVTALVGFNNVANAINTLECYISPVSNGSVGVETELTSVYTTNDDTYIYDIEGLKFGDNIFTNIPSSLQVYNGTSWVFTNFAGKWGVDTLSGTDSFTELLCRQILENQQNESFRLNLTSALSENGKFLSDGTSLIGKYINPIGRLKDSGSGNLPYVFLRGDFHMLKDQWTGDWFQIEKISSTINTVIIKKGGLNTGPTGSGTLDSGPVGIMGGSVARKQPKFTQKIGTTSADITISQSPITSIPINLIGETLFKSGDTVELYDPYTETRYRLVLTSNQFSDSSSLDVASFAITTSIYKGSYIIIDDADLSSQYQNKTKGTVAGFDITANGIEKSSINITDWLNSDTMTGAAVTNVPTALSVKNYVDNSHPAEDQTLQEVTDNGNTTTNSIMIGSSSAPASTLHVKGSNSGASAVASGTLIVEQGSAPSIQILSANSQQQNIKFGDPQDGDVGRITYSHPSNYMSFTTNGTERMRLTSGGNLLLNTTTDSGAKLNIETPTAGTALLELNYTSGNSFQFQNGIANVTTDALLIKDVTNNRNYITLRGDNVGINQLNPTEKLHVVGKGIFTDQLTIPATPVASTDAASKGYVDAQVATTDTLSEVLAIGNTTGGTDIVVSANDDIVLNSAGATYSKLIGSENSSKYFALENGSGYGIWSSYSGFVFRTAIGNTERMRLTTTGLGIGTTAPDSLLEISSSSTSNFLKLTTAGGGANPIKLVFEKSSVEQGVIEYNRNGDLEIYNTDSDGGVMIDGSSSAGADLYVNNSGNTILTGSLTGTTASFSGDLTTLGTLFYDGFLRNRVNSKLILSNDTSKTEIHSGGTTGIIFKNNGNVEKMRLTSGGNLLIGTTTDSGQKLVVNGNAKYSGKILAGIGATAAATINAYTATVATNLFSALRILENTGASSYWDIGATGGSSTVLNFFHNANTTPKISFTHLGGATFSGQVTIPATPVASTDAASKSYVDAQVGASDTLQEVTDNGNTTTNSITFAGGTSTAPLLIDANTAQALIIDSTSDTLIRFRINGASAGFIQTTLLDFIMYNAHSGSFRWLENGGTERMRLTDGGNLLIGTTSDNGSKLQVNGNATFAGDLLVSHTGNSTINVQSTNDNAILKIDANSGGGGFGNNQDPYLQFASANIIKANIYYDNTNTNLIFQTNTNVTALTLDNSQKATFSGNVALTNGFLSISGDGSNAITFVETGAGKLTVSASDDIILDCNSDIVLDAGGSDIRLKVSGTEYGKFNNAGSNLNIFSSILNKSILFLTNNTEKVRISTGGNLLIGTTTDSGHKLQVNSGTTNVTSVFKSNDNQAWVSVQDDSSGTFGALYGTDSDAGHEIAIANKDAVKRLTFGTNGKLNLSAYGSGTFTGTATKTLGVTSSGNVIELTGGGAGGPYLPLAGGTLTGALTGTTATFSGHINVMGGIQVASGTFVDSTRRNIYLNSFAAGGGAGIFFRDGFTYNASITAEDHNGSSADGICISGFDGVSFSTGSNSKNERARITQSGNLLLGTTSDGGDKLTVAGSVRFTQNVSFSSSNSGRIYKASNHGLAIHGVFGTENDFALFTPSGQLKIVIPTNTNNLILNRDSGNVLIGTATNSGEKLVVNGNIETLLQAGKIGFDVGDSYNSGNFAHYGLSKVTGNNLLNLSGYFGLSFGTTGLERARITSGGNLLLGTTTDSGDKLNINGSINIPFSSSYGYKINGNRILSQPGSSFEFGALDYKSIYPNISVNNDGTFRILFNGTESLRVSSNRNILIGSTSDNGAKLQVTASATNDPIIEISNSDNGGVAPSLTINGTNTASSALIDLNRTNVGRTSAIRYLTNGTVDWHSGVFYNGGSSQSNFGIGTDRNLSNQKLIITSGGKVGIGTTSPSHTLTVNASTSSGIAVNNVAGSLVAFLYHGGVTGSEFGRFYLKSLTTTNEVYFAASGNSYINSGNVGIGITNPTEKLHVVGKGIFTDQLTIPATPVASTDAASKSYVDAKVGTADTLSEVLALGNTTSGNDMIFTDSDELKIGNGSDLRLYHDGSDSYIRNYTGSLHIDNEASGQGLIFKTEATERARITSAGNVIIGTTVDSGYKLGVNGTGSFFGNIRSGGGTLWSDSNGGVQLGYNASDATGYLTTYFNTTSIVIGAGVSQKTGITINGSSASAGNQIIFRVGNSERARITSGGNLLLGTTVDSAKLTVDETTTNNLTVAHFKHNQGAVLSDILLENSAGANNTGFSINFKLASSGVSAKIGAIRTNIPGAGDTDMVFSTSTNGGSVTEAMRIVHNSNVLIGTTTDSGEKLQVEGNIELGTGGYIYGDTTTPYLRLNNAVGTVLGYSTGYITLGPTFAYVTSTGEKFRINHSNGNVLIGSTSDNGQKLQVTGNVRITGSFQVANTGGFLLADTGGSMRYGLKYGAAGAVGSSNLLMLTNRSLSSATGGGEVAISANASTSGVTETEVMRIKANTQSQVSIDGVLSLTSQNTPADPPNRASTIWLDSNFDLKIKITNNSGVTVTKTLAEYA